MPDSKAPVGNFASRLVAWQREHGRHGLPWQHNRDPYRVWLSEVMLQQTQVVTVLGYFERFLQRYPNVTSLAQAPLDDVLALWSGLGYYSRARNLHRCAQVVVSHHAGVFPSDVVSLSALPGIGPSTAAAVAAFCFGQRVTIFDGNVKRVVARYLGFPFDLSIRQHERDLQAQAETLLPESDLQTVMSAYTQGLMDLGATLCTRHQPQCHACPMQLDCVAHATQRQTALPVKTRRMARKTQEWFMLVATRPDGAVWLMRRPSKGIWASLFAFPVAHALDSLLGTAGLSSEESAEHLPSFTHALTHLDMIVCPISVRVPEGWMPQLAESPANSGVWVIPHDTLPVGVPVPVKRILASL